jgi:hypothetical protein
MASLIQVPYDVVDPAPGWAGARRALHAVRLVRGAPAGLAGARRRTHPHPCPMRRARALSVAAALAALAAGLRVAAAPPACPPALAPWPAGDAPEPALADARAGAELAPVWEHRVRPGARLRFDGIVDGAGHVYWVEERADARGGEIVSATRSGALRFRARSSGGRVALAGAVLVSEARGDGCRGLGAPALEAHRTADGAIAWRREILPAIERWMRAPGSCRYGALGGLAVSGGRVVVAASILDGDTKEHESGFVALDARTGEVAAAWRTSAADNASRSGAPRAAEDGAVYASRALTASRDALLVLDGAAPRELAAAPTTLHRDVVAAFGPLLFDEGLASQDPTLAAGSTLEARCRATGEVLGTFPAGRALALLVPGSAFVLGAQLSRHDTATGELAWRVRLGAPPAPSSARGRVPLLLRTEPVATRGGGVLFAEQPGIVQAALARFEADRAVLREIDGDGRESLRRALPAGAEVYEGPAALDRGRWYVAARPYHAAEGGVLRAFDLPGRAAAAHGWVTPQGSMARDNRAR